MSNVYVKITLTQDDASAFSKFVAAAPSTAGLRPLFSGRIDMNVALTISAGWLFTEHAGTETAMGIKIAMVHTVSLLDLQFMKEWAEHVAKKTETSLKS